MKRVGNTLAVILVWATALSAVGAGVAKVWAANPAQMTIRVWDRVQIDTRTLDIAKSVSAAVFSRIGIDVTWMHCGIEQTLMNLPCQSATGPNEISMRIIRLSEVNGQPWRSLACGVAMPREGASGIIYVFYDRVEAAYGRTRQATPLELILGVTMAHEIGHLLLPPGHSLKGIMRARLDTEDWKLAEVGRLVFCRQEAERIMNALDGDHRP